MRLMQVQAFRQRVRMRQELRRQEMQPVLPAQRVCFHRHRRQGSVQQQ